MNLTFLTTLLALVASSALAQAHTSNEAHAQQLIDSDARQLRGFGGRRGNRGNRGNSGSTPAKPPAPAPAPAKRMSKGDAVDGTIAGIELTAAVLSLVPPPGSKNACRQVACWVATTTENCGMAAANKVQADVMRGRDAFTVESTGESGMWVRYWRTQFMPPNQDTVAEGSCGGDSKFVVTNCQAAGEVKC